MFDLLPHEILFEILSRLPITSLARFKCVSKTWLSVISDPVMQQKLASRGPKVLLSSPSALQSLDCSKASFTDEGAFVNLDFPLRKPNEDIRIIGSCNGLVCVALNMDKDFFLWNPSTGIYKKLPGFSRNDLFEGNISMCGFGYDSSTDDYKVVCSNLANDGSLCGNRFRILAAKADSWREIKHSCSIQCCNVHCWQRPQGSLLNGTLHWLTKWLCRHGKCHAISAFDLAEEKLYEVPMPNVGRAEEVRNFTMLSVLDGYLCLIYSEWPNGYVELWMMQEYGVQSTWEKRFRLAENFHEISHEFRLVPLCFTMSTEVILINNGEELLRFKPKDRTVESLMISRHQLAEATAYVESLVSPNVLSSTSRINCIYGESTFTQYFYMTICSLLFYTFIKLFGRLWSAWSPFQFF